ncbi:hypothetical protein ACTXT7_004391 [Hymenolepis weldensis]
MREIVNLIVTPGSLQINIVCPQVTYPHRSEKLSVPRMIVAEAPLTRRYFITNAVHTVPSFSYNRPDQLKHAHNHDLTRVLIQLRSDKTKLIEPKINLLLSFKRESDCQ